MSLKSKLLLWSAAIGDVLMNAAQAAAIGASFGNGAAQFGQDPKNLLQMGDDGNLVVQIPNGSSGISPATTGNDNVLAIFTIPAAAFDIAFRGISILAAGNCPNTNAKTLKIIANPTNPVIGQAVSGGTTVASLTATGANTQGGWQMQANLFKYGNAGSNTQIALHEASQVASTIGTLVAPSPLTLNEANTMTFAVTGNATTAAADIVLNFLQVFAMN